VSESQARFAVERKEFFGVLVLCQPTLHLMPQRGALIGGSTSN